MALADPSVHDVSRLVSFFRDGGHHRRGWTHADILCWDDARLEQCHDFIQWMFPLPEPSAAAPNSPVLDEDDVETFLASPAMRDTLSAGFRRMLSFYGFETDGTTIRRSPAFGARTAKWLRPGDHNMLRITRILRSMEVLGCGDQARTWLACLAAVRDDYDGRIPAVTWAHWERAAGRPPGFAMLRRAWSTVSRMAAGSGQRR